MDKDIKDLVNEALKDADTVNTIHEIYQEESDKYLREAGIAQLADSLSQTEVYKKGRKGIERDFSDFLLKWGKIQHEQRKERADELKKILKKYGKERNGHSKRN